MLPLGDYPNPPKPQWATRILIAINVAVYFFVSVPLDNKGITDEDRADPETRALLDEMYARTLTVLESRGEREIGRPGLVRDSRELRESWERGVTQNDIFQERFGYKPGSPSLVALLLCMFLHAGFMHLFGNMLFLWIYGDNIEYRLGAVPYLIAYLGTGIVATIAFSLFKADSTVPLVGASGAISGVLGFYLVWFPYNYIRVLFFFPPFFWHWIHVRAVFVLLFFLVWDNLLPLLIQRGTGGGGVAYAAHLGGFVAGVIAALLFDRTKGRIAAPRPAYGATGARTRPRPVVSVRESIADRRAHFTHAIEHGQMEDAAHAFAALAREGGSRPEPRHVFLLANWLYDNDFTKDAAAVFRYYLKSFPQGADLDRVNLGLGILLARRLGQPTGARQYLFAAIDLSPGGSQVAEVAREELKRIEDHGDSR